MNKSWKAAPWIGKVILLMWIAVFVFISIEPLAHPIANAAAQGIAFTSSIGATIFRVSFAGFPLGCATFLVYCLFSNRRTLTGLVFSTFILGILLLVRIYGMEADSTVRESMSLVKPEIILVIVALVGIAIEKRREHHFVRAA
jgi:hypothetical protein